MKISDVDIRDGKACAVLINLLRDGKWTMSGPEIEGYRSVLQWVHNLALLMAEQLRGKPGTESPATPAVGSSTAGLRVKSIGTLPSPTKSPKRKKK